MGGANRPNNADEKMIAAIERGDQSEFQDRKPPKNPDKKMLKARKAKQTLEMSKLQELKALRLAAEKEHAEDKAKK